MVFDSERAKGLAAFATAAFSFGARPGRERERERGSARPLSPSSSLPPWYRAVGRGRSVGQNQISQTKEGNLRGRCRRRRRLYETSSASGKAKSRRRRGGPLARSLAPFRNRATIRRSSARSRVRPAVPQFHSCTAADKATAEQRSAIKQSKAQHFLDRSVGRSLAFLSISPSERETDDPSDDQGRTKTTEPPSPRTKAIQESEASFYECTKVEGEPKEEKRRRKESICCRFQFVHRRLLLRTRRERERERAE